MSLKVTFDRGYTLHVHCEWGVYFTEDVIVTMTIEIVVYSAVTRTLYISILMKVKIQNAHWFNLGTYSSLPKNIYKIKTVGNRCH